MYFEGLRACAIKCSLQQSAAVHVQANVGTRLGFPLEDQSVACAQVVFSAEKTQNHSQQMVSFHFGLLPRR